MSERARRLLPVVAASLLLAGSASAVQRVTPGGLVRAMAGHPTEPGSLLLLTDRDELVVVDVAAGSVTGRVPLPGTAAAALAVEPGGTRAWAGLQWPAAMVPVDLATLEVGTPLLFSRDGVPADAVFPRPERMIVSLSGGVGGLVVLDPAAGAELLVHPEPRYGSDLALRSDGRVLYALVGGVSPTSLIAFDVTEDEPVWIGEDCCHGCIGSNGRQVAVSVDDSRLYVAAGAPYHLKVLDAVGLFFQHSSVLTSNYPNAVAVHPGGSRVYAGHDSAAVLVVDAASGLVRHREPLPGSIAPRGLLVAPDGSWVAALHAEGGFDPVTVSLFGPAELETASLGAVSVRALDPVTGEPVNAWMNSVERVDDSTWNWRDLPAGRASWGPAPAGSHELRIRAGTLYEEQLVTVDVVAGEWTDLGDVVLTRTGSEHPAPDGACVNPPLVPGRRMEVRVHGKNYVNGPGLALSMPADVTVHSWEWESSSTLRAEVTADPSMRRGVHTYVVRVTNPGGTSDTGDLGVAEWPDLDPSVDRIPPAEVQRLFVRKREGRLPGFLLEWTEVTLQEDGSPETMGDYQVFRDRVEAGEQADFEGAALWVETPELSYLWVPPPDGQLGPFETFRVRARDAAGNVGRLSSP